VRRPQIHSVELTEHRIDVTGSLVLDTVPRFSIPHYATVDPKPHPSPRIFAFSLKWTTKFPDVLDISESLTSLASLASHVNNQKTKNGLRQGELFVALNVHPVAHKLLSIPRYAAAARTNMSSSGLIINEILRLTSLLFIALLKEQFRVLPSGVSENRLRLALLLTKVTVDWSSFMDLHLWVLTVSALAETEDRSWYVSKLAVTMTFLGLTAWDEALKILRELIWVGDMLDEAADELGRELADFGRPLASWEIST